MSDVGNVHSGEVEGELEGVLRTLVASAGRIGETIARAREEAARRAEAESTQRARELQAQYEQERVLARAQVQPVNEPAWWDRASAEDIAHAYETTAAWKDDDPNLADAHAKMGDELRERYGLDVNDLDAEPQRVADVLREREAAGEVIDVQGSTPEERRAADTLLNAADRHDQAAEAARSDAAVMQELGPDYGDEAPTSVQGPDVAVTLTAAEFAMLSAVASNAATEHDNLIQDEGEYDAPDAPNFGAVEQYEEKKGAWSALSDKLTAAQAAATSEQSAGDQDRAAGESTWDSANRRDTHAVAMASQGVNAVAIQAQYGADVSNAKHPRASVGSSRVATKARKAATKMVGITREREERGR